MRQFLNEGVLHGGVFVRRLCDNVGASDVEIGVNGFFPRETDWMKIIVCARVIEQGPCFGNHFVNGSKTVIAVVFHGGCFGAAVGEEDLVIVSIAGVSELLEVLVLPGDDLAVVMVYICFGSMS